MGATALVLRRGRAPALLAAAGLLLVVPATLPPAGTTAEDVARGAELWRGQTGAILVIDGSDPVDLAAAMRRHRVGRLDVVVATGRRDTAAVEAVGDRVRVGTVVGLGDGMVDPGAGWSHPVGPWRVTAVRMGSRVEAEVSPASEPPLPSPTDARSP